MVEVGKDLKDHPVPILHHGQTGPFLPIFLFAGSPALHWALTQGSAWDTLGKRKERPKWPFPDMGSVKHLHGIEGTGKNHSSPTPAAAGTEKEGDIFQPPYDKGSLLLGRSTHHPVPNWVGKRK